MSESKRKFGEGALSAAWRQGHKEIGQMLKAFPDSIMIEEPGQMNNPTSHGISQQAGYVQPVSSVENHINDVREMSGNSEPQKQVSMSNDIQQESSIVDQHVQDVSDQDGPEPPEMDMDK